MHQRERARRQVPQPVDGGGGLRAQRGRVKDVFGRGRRLYPVALHQRIAGADGREQVAAEQRSRGVVVVDIGIPAVRDMRGGEVIQELAESDRHGD